MYGSSLFSASRDPGLSDDSEQQKGIKHIRTTSRDHDGYLHCTYLIYKIKRLVSWGSLKSK